MIIGRKKANFRIRFYDVEKGTSKCVSLHVSKESFTMQDLVHLVLNGLREKNDSI